MMWPTRFTRGLAACLKHWVVAGMLSFACATANAVSIAPVLVELTPARRVISITFTNPDDQALRYQTQVMAWSQVDGVDRREPTDELIVAPPIAEIPPGGSQIFRVALRGPATGHEQTYRVIFEDVTEVTAAAPSTDSFAVHLQVTHDLPVFVAATGNPQAQLQLGPCLDQPAGTMTCVRLNNSGNRYAQVKSLTLERGTWRKELPISARVLAGAWRQWELELPAETSGPLRVTVQSRDGDASIELPVDIR
jgi:fimbrial chaperone protein